MKSFKHFCEDAPANAVTATSPSSVAGITPGETPPITPKKQKKYAQDNMSKKPDAS